MTAAPSQTEEYKGAMRLPRTDHQRITALATLTHRSLNDLVVEAIEFLCTVAEGEENQATLPDAVVTARALRAHRTNPQKLVLIHEATGQRTSAESRSRRKHA